MIARLEEMIRQYEAEGKFFPEEVTIDSASTLQIVKLRGNPQRFVPGLFDGNWAEPGEHPFPGEARVLRVLTGHDKVSRAIMRQGRALFVYPLV